ncbi:unnamed protein product [Rotaria sordida]|uniref:Uncharacterized protein n=1 Tax=Rotaria sordida TaxID=392033 RepID=A0A815H1E0_9BILA|nr:unnamed protein product [Rotaria sordida]CAF1599180.1 unnamed protein product [Rotaria sordida]
MLAVDTHSRLYCVHYVSSNIDCLDCRLTEKDYINRPLHALLYVLLPNLSTVLDNSQHKLPNTFYVPFNEKNNNFTRSSLLDDCVEIKTKNGIVRIPRSTLVHRSPFLGDFQKHVHRFTRNFSWKTKPEEPPFSQMQPLPKLIKQPAYVEMCCKNDAYKILNTLIVYNEKIIDPEVLLPLDAELLYYSIQSTKRQQEKQ